MSIGVLLAAAALIIAPWRGPAGVRLRELVPRSARDRTWSVVGALPPVIAERWPRRGRAVPPGTLARLLDLLSVALLAGLPTHVALAAVADALDDAAMPGAVSALRAAAARLRLGASADEVWAGAPGAGDLAPVLPDLTRAVAGGGSVRAALEHSADRMRSEADAAAVARAERAAVLVAGPLGLCFLPAFVCLGIAPVVVGLADGMLPGMLP